MKIQHAILAGAFAVIGCATQSDPTSSTDDSQDVPTSAVCTGGTQRCFAQIVLTDDGSRAKTAATPTGLGAADLKAAYSLKTVTTSPGTIAVVDAYGYANAESDLAKYRSQYGLPACTSASGCFKKINQTGATSPLPGAPPAGDDWTVEAALDLDMASAACPTCKLILVEATNDSGTGLYVANNAAASAGATAISNSWGGDESGTSFETDFNHPGEFASSGDDGYTGSSPQYPSTSLHVTAVGGTSLKKSSASRGWTETAWTDAGSSCSKTFAKPSYQSSITTGCTKRAAADVSSVADPNTGVAVYNASNGGWIEVGGTSASSPFVAGVYVLYGLAGQAPGWAYSHTTDFYDITSGKNGSCTTALCKAGTGWDGPTGIGSPNGSKL